MRKPGLVLVCALLALSMGLNVLAQEESNEKTREKESVIVHERALERSLRELERLQEIEIPPLPEMAEFPEIPPIPEVHVEIPEIHIPEIEIPEFHFEMDPVEIPEIHVDIPEIEMPEFAWDYDFHFEGVVPDWSGGVWEPHNRFENLSDAEELRIQALRAIARDDDKEAIAMVKKVLQQDESAAVRYHAVRALRPHLDNDKVIELLGQTAKHDDHADVKKAAIRLLGKSGSTRAVEILQDILQAK